MTTNFWIRAMLRTGLRAPPSHSREGTAIAIATHERPDWRLAYSSSAWACARSSSWVSRWWPCTREQWVPALRCQEATVRSSRPKAATAAGRGQPWASKVTTHRNRDWSVCRRKKGVPLVAAKVFLQVAQRKRRSFLEWTFTLPLSLTPLSVQAGLAQNTPLVSTARLRRLRLASLSSEFAVDTLSGYPSSPFTVPWGATPTRSRPLKSVIGTTKRL